MEDRRRKGERNGEEEEWKEKSEREGKSEEGGIEMSSGERRRDGSLFTVYKRKCGLPKQA